MTCPHAIWEMDAACADGMCPLCLAVENVRLAVENVRHQYAAEKDAKTMSAIVKPPNADQLYAQVQYLEAEVERLRGDAEQDAKTIGDLQYLLRELLLCELDDKAEALIHSALEEKR